MRGSFSRGWTRIQEQPLEFALAIIAILSAVPRLSGHQIPPLTFATGTLWVVLLVGGIAMLFGRLRASLSMESVALALLTGAYLFTTLHSVGLAGSFSDVVFALFRYAGLALGLLIRLYVVRKAMKARTIARG